MDRKYRLLLEKYDKVENKRIFWIAGCPNVGKSFLVLDYIRQNYENYFYIDYINNIEFQKKVHDLDSLCSYFSIDRTNLLYIPLIIDNVRDTEFLKCICQESSSVLPKLFFTSNRYVNDSDFPKSDLFVKIDIYPISFNEFLKITGHEWYLEIINGHIENRKKIPEMIHNELLDLFDVFLSTGGMPEIIEEYLKFENTTMLGSRKSDVAAAVNAEILNCPYSDVKINGIINAVRNIYQKRNRKFMYSEIRKGLSEKQYNDCVDYLVKSRYLYKINRINSNKEIIPKDFRLYFYDFGIYNISDNNMITGNLESSDNSLIENYMIQCLSALGIEGYYYESGTGAVVDFIIKHENELIPVDIKLPGFNKSISVMNFTDKTKAPFIIQTGTDNVSIPENALLKKNYGEELIIPIYAMENLLLLQK